ncbi:MAG TPA: MarR family transcriptional regulator [Holophaga sp.]|nr:MarR family transcriptional regulator [Holophaga sp.]
MKDDFTHSALPESSLSMLIAAARRQVKHAVAAAVEPYGLNAYHCWMIVLLRDRGAMSLSELAGRMWMDHPTTSRLVHALEEMGLLKIQPDPTHGRRVLIDIDAGKREVADAIHERVLDYRNLLERGLSPEEKGVLHSALGKVILNLEELLEKAGNAQFETSGVQPKGLAS